MAMPRYKYALGPAPVRFPSTSSRPASEAPDPPSPSMPSSSSSSPKPAEEQRRSRWSLFSPSDSLDPGTDTRPATVSSHRQPSDEKRPRCKSMHSATGPSPQPSRAASPAEQPRERPRSMSVFWTEISAEAAGTDSSAGAGAGTGKQTPLMTSASTTYGAVSLPASSSGTPRPATIYPDDDPYGYRSLAGPTLLPSYYSSQQTAGPQPASSSGASASATFRRWTGRLVALVTLATVVYCTLAILL